MLSDRIECSFVLDKTRRHKWPHICGIQQREPGVIEIVRVHDFLHNHIRNQSVENADVAFVKGANERNEFFEKKKKKKNK